MGIYFTNTKWLSGYKKVTLKDKKQTNNKKKHIMRAFADISFTVQRKIEVYISIYTHTCVYIYIYIKCYLYG